MTAPLWESWAPPLDPPTTGGMPYDVAAGIAALYWPGDPHLTAALQWEYYAATLPPSPAVSQVNTGAQSVSYDPAVPVGDYGAALERARWHRSFVADEMVSVPLVVDTPLRGDPSWWIDP
jgi:hypothetical protein